MNIDPNTRIDQIEINLDRIRWIAKALEGNHIRVNVPAFQLSVHDSDHVHTQMRVIVGSKENSTPIISGDMQYLVFSPYWNIPLSIATKEVWPKIKEDSRYLEKQQMEVVRTTGNKVVTVKPSEVDWDEISEEPEYQLRQKPGVSNALGLVKFIFPNPFNVYLHDTPGDNLFDRLTRGLSHGCIRLERPAELAAYVLRDQPEWTRERIESAMHEGKETRVSLKNPLPVHILYWTAWVGDDGQVQFRDDLYGHDEKHSALVCRAVSCSE